MLVFYDSGGVARPLQHIIKNYCLTRKYDGNNSISFNLDKESDEYKLVTNETAIEDGENRYLVKKINGDKFDCSLDLDFLKSSVYIGYSSDSSTLAETLRAHLPTGWIVSGANVRSIRRTIEFDYCTDYDIVQKCMSVYDVCFVWHIIDKELVVVAPEMIEPSGEYLTDELNLRKVSYKSETTSFVTRLYAYGKDGLTFASINDGKEYVDNTSYSSKVVCGYWSDNRYTVKENLLEAAQKKVDELSCPVATYECDVIDIAKQNPKEYSFLDFQMHKIVTLIDGERSLKVNHHIVQYKEYPDEPDRNVITLSAVAETITSSTQKLENELLEIIGEKTWTLEKAIENATEKIVYELEGHVYIRHNEILIMDTENPATATGLWRWTYGGLGFSNTGYNGTYSLALTNDGQIVADRITAGELNGVILKANSVQASAISQAFKQSIQDDISSTHTTITQEFTAADNAVKSVISAATSKYDTSSYNVELFGYGTPESQGYAASDYDAKFYLDQQTGFLYLSNKQRWNKSAELDLITSAMNSSFTQTIGDIRGEISTAQTNAETHSTEYTDSKIVQTSKNIILTVTSSVQQYDFSEYYTDSQISSMKILYGVGTDEIKSGGTYVDEKYYNHYYLDQSDGDLYFYSESKGVWELEHKLHLTTSNLGSRITQNANSITAVVGDVNNLDKSFTNFKDVEFASLKKTVSEQETTIESAFSTISQTADAIEATVAGALNKYDTSSVTIQLYGYGVPKSIASMYKDKKYLDQETGYVYTSNGSEWVKSSKPLALITDNITSQIAATAKDITLDYSTKFESYYTKTETDSKISVSESSIKSTVSSAMSKYDTTGYTVNYRGFGAPAEQGYAASDYSGKYYLNQNNGYLYLSDGSTWMKKASLKLITTNLQTQISQNATNITLRVAKDDLVSEINASSGTISMKSNRFTVDSTNFKLTANGTITATSATLKSATITGSLTTATADSAYLYVHGNQLEFFRDKKRLAYITPISYSSTYYQLGIMASGNYHGITIGGAYDNGWETYYRCNIQGAATDMDCRHYFYGDIKFGDGKIKSLINFDDNVGVAWGGNTGLRYWNNNATYGTGLYLGIAANECNTYVVGNSITMRCDTWVQNHNLYVRKGYVDIDDSYGIRCTGTIAFRWVNSNALFVGMDSYNLKLVGSNIYANGSPVATTSDERKKTDITPLSDKYLKIIKAIKPVSFKYDTDISLSGRTHTGFTAQDVLKAMDEAGVTAQEFAAFVDVDGDGKDYALRYEEFISPLLLYIKHLEDRISVLERTG